MDEFRVLLLTLGAELTSEELRSIKFALRDVIPAGTMERLNRPTDLFTELENMGYLGKDNKELLADVFDKIGRQDLRYKTLGINENAPPLYMSPKVIDESIINSISEDIGTDWKRLGRELKIKESRISNIDVDYRQTREKAFQIVLKWKQMNGNKATIGELMNALITIGRRDIAEVLDKQDQPVGGRTPSEAQDVGPLNNMAALDPSRYMQSERLSRNSGIMQYVAPLVSQPSDQDMWTKNQRYDGKPNRIVADAAVTVQERRPAEERHPVQDSQVQQPVKYGSYLDSDKYDKIKMLGAGSFGKVFLVKMKRVASQDKYVAVKQVDLGMNEDDVKEIVDALINEMSILSKLDHENILKVYKLEEKYHTLNLFMEWMPGGSISQWIKERPIPDNRVKSYAHQILKGLEYLHSKGKIHRDIKGENVLIAADVERVKLADFGISHDMEKLQKATGTGFKATKSGLGAVYWKCPELLKNEDFNANCDIWSLGCTVVEMIRRKAPYGHLAPFQAILQILQGGIEIPEGCTPNLRDFLSLCFRDKSGRPSAAELLKHCYFDKVPVD